MSERGVHDVGGARDAYGPIVRDSHAFAPWEVRVDAMMVILTGQSGAHARTMTVDELRRAIEAMSADDYRELGYYAKWVRALAQVMIERGTFTRAELDAKLAELEGATT